MRGTDFAKQAAIVACLFSFFASPQIRAANHQISNSIRVVALTGESAPDSPGWDFTRLDAPVINDRGQVAFAALISNPSSPLSPRLGIWSEGTGELGLVSLSVTPLGGIQIPADRTTYFAFKNRGETTFVDTGIMLHRDGSLQKLVPTNAPLQIDGQTEQLDIVGRPVLNQR